MGIQNQERFRRTSLEETRQDLRKASLRELVLEQLCRIHWPSLYVQAKSAGYSTADAEDLTQGFFIEFLRSNRIEKYRTSRGNLRSFLSSAFRHYLIDDIRSKGAEKRGGKVPHTPIHSPAVKYELRHEPPAQSHGHDREWALGIYAAAIRQLRLQYEGKGKQDLFNVIGQFLLPGTAKGLDYREAGEELSTSEAGIRNAVFRMRRHFKEKVLEELRDTVTENEDFGDALRYVIRVIGLEKA
ncbi:MAG: sigma-70 family RNA polymerase sigma factor [Verrucomicrobiales bacterium]|nr:sigma-70 family RNA polymerase sigma factor [Verrucomicrobiales bacterium]